MPTPLTLPYAALIDYHADEFGRLNETRLKDASAVTLNLHHCDLGKAHQKSNQPRLGSHVDSIYFDEGQLRKATAVEDASGVAHRHENLEYTYDAAGNPRTYGGLIDDYDNENRLKRVSYLASAGSRGGAVNYIYDGLSRLRVRQVLNEAGNITSETRYVDDGIKEMQERAQDNKMLVIYTRGLDLSGSRGGAGGIGGLLARRQAVGASVRHAFYHSDGASNITVMINGAQKVVARYLYDSFSNPLGQAWSLAKANTYRLSSKEFDNTTGLYYFGYRFYEPFLQRWLQRDPIGEQGGINLYQFVGNHPLSYADPYGLDWQDYIPGWVDPVGDYFAGWGDSLCFSFARRIRDANPDFYQSDNSSGAYLGGKEPAFCLGLGVSRTLGWQKDFA